MLDKFKKMFNEKDEKKKNENLVAFLIILVITLVIINKILSKDEKRTIEKNEVENSSISFESKEVSYNKDLEKELENILSKISGVGKVNVLLTYSESSSILPLYNENLSSSKNVNSNGESEETSSSQKEVFTDSSNSIVIQKKFMPKIEGAIIIAEGAGNLEVKSNLVVATEAATRAT